MARALSGGGGSGAIVSGAAALKAVTALYLLVWVATGLAAYVVGAMWADPDSPRSLQQLTDLGQAWLGLAVAAAYAYLGVRP